MKIKIMFICGSLEPGKDGVGDYTTRLCSQIIKMGYEAAIAAINDRHTKSYFSTTMYMGEKNFEVLRIPDTWSSSRKYLALFKWANAFQPHLFCLQYVPYGFHRIGTPIILASKLKKIYPTARWEVMVHEPYLNNPQKGAKNKLIQFLQIMALKRINKVLKPIVFHTSVLYYQQMLRDIGINSKLLGLFGNITIAQNAVCAKEWLSADGLTGVFFGFAPPIHQHEIFAELIREFCRKSNTRLRILLCGRGGPSAEQFAATIRSKCEADNFELIGLGMLTSNEISALFAAANFGISRVPARLLGKSGVATSMLEHGLPLWIPLSESENDMALIEFRPELCYKNLFELVLAPARASVHDRLNEIALHLLNDIKIGWK